MNWLEQALSSEYDVVSSINPKTTRLRHKDLQQDLLKIETRGDAEVYRRICGISHPNLAGIFDVFEEDEKIILLEEFIDGSNFADLLEVGLFSEDAVRRIVSALCDGLYALHSRGIVHRDIKPENIMVDSQGRVVLIDYDAARIFKSGRSQDTRILGTAGYAAPEQFGITQTDERADIYSLGILMNVLLTGCHPSAKLYDGKLRKIIERCTHIDPQKRFADTLELKNNL